MKPVKDLVRLIQVQPYRELLNRSGAPPLSNVQGFALPCKPFNRPRGSAALQLR
jgi:hypothetical protein